MNWKDIPAGRHLAKANRARFSESSAKGTPMIEVEFELSEYPGVNIRWQGWLTEKTLERTMETMALLDYNLDETFGPGSFNTEKQLALVIERETSPDGKVYPKVQWVNDPSKSAAFASMDPSAFKAKIRGFNLKAELETAKKRLGIKEIKNHAPQFNADEEVPF